MSENVKTDIVGAINEKAEITRAEIIADAERYAEERNTAAADYSARLTAETEEVAKSLAEDIIGKSRVAARMESNKIKLGAKRKAVGRVYDLLCARLTKATAEEFLELVAAVVEKYGETGQKLIVAVSSPVDIKAVTGLDAVVAKRIVAEQSEELKNGFVLSCDKYDRVFTYEAIVETVREKTEREFAEKFFGENQ